MIEKVYGPASSFYRVKLTFYDESIPSEFEWKNGASFFPPDKGTTGEQLKYAVEIVEIDTKASHKIKSFSNKQKAGKLLKDVENDLSEMTINEFKNKYSINGNYTIKT
ncbi:MAG: hypothetical protein KAS39_07855 [Actinomycetia bacterium]|nr:hypothetical protein [Actinomycetes bacterium]